MRNRRAFILVVIVALFATGAAQAGNARQTRPAAQAAPISVDASHAAWDQILSTYGLLLRIHLLQIIPGGPEIEGVQDGPEGVDPLGIKPKPIKGLIPKYQEEQPPPAPVS